MLSARDEKRRWDEDAAPAAWRRRASEAAQRHPAQLAATSGCAGAPTCHRWVTDDFRPPVRGAPARGESILRRAIGPRLLQYREGVRVDLRDALRADAPIRSHRALIGSVLLAVLVVAAAGIGGTVHFGGPRWFPNLKLSGHTPVSRSVAPTTVKVPPRPAVAHSTGGFALGTVILWVAVAIAALVVALLLWRWWADRPARAATRRHSFAVEAVSEVPVAPEPDPEPDTPALRTGIELALQALDEQREPADAIVRAWLGLQETAEQSGIVRLPAETPTEFTSRILSRAFTDAGAVRTLLRLYLRTRFGDHPVTREDVAAVREALKELIRTWPAPETLATTARR